MADHTANWAAHLEGDTRPLEVGILLFNGHTTTLDFVGPYTAFTAVGMKVHLVSDTLDPVLPDDGGLAIAPTAIFDDCPERLDIPFVPGGFVEKAMLDQATIAFLADRGATASYIISVCNGALVLAAAGLLDGYRSATHWAARDHLAQLGVEVSTELSSLSWPRSTVAKAPSARRRHRDRSGRRRTAGSRGCVRVHHRPE
ncbi:DJ-1/PfpI family protein [Streptomyces tubercidicus]|uniref:DJ-1/PfpI family protein n=1 Tax=Streptomyces tubercidicus TaxID=47759 RepID=UPI0037A3EC9B